MTDAAPQETFAPDLLAGRTAFVAGGTSGINLGIAHRFAGLGAQRCLQIADDAAQRVAPKRIEQEQHQRLLAELVVDDVHALQLEVGALLGCRVVALDVVFGDAVQLLGQLDAGNLGEREL